MKPLFIAGFIALGSIAQAETVALFSTMGDYSASSTSTAGVTLELAGGYELFVGDPASYGFDSYTISASLELDGVSLFDDAIDLDFDASPILGTVDSAAAGFFALPSPLALPGAGATWSLTGSYALDTVVMGEYDATLTGDLSVLIAAAALFAGVDLPLLDPITSLSGSGTYAISVELSKEDIGDVPLPASGMLMLAAFGGLAVSRSRKS